MTATDARPRRSRLRPCPAAGLVLTERDRTILRIGLLNPAFQPGHVQPLFPSVKSRNERLRELFDHRYLARSFPAGSAFGSPVYHLGRRGVPIAAAGLAAEGLDLSEDEIAALARRPSLSVLDHALRTADVYCACCHGTASGALECVRFYPEPLVRFEYEVRRQGGDSAKGRWQQRCFAPDGALLVRSRRTGRRLLAFLEIDMATVPLARFGRKCAGFRHVVQGGLVTPRFGDCTAVLAIVTVTDRRRSQILRTLGDGAGDALVATFAEVQLAGLSVAWARVGSRPATIVDLIERGGPACTV
jgi:hypothetical protein